MVWIDNAEALARANTLNEGGGGEYSLTFAQHIRLNQERVRAAKCEQSKVIFELSCDKEAIPAKFIADAALVCKIL